MFRQSRWRMHSIELCRIHKPYMYCYDSLIYWLPILRQRGFEISPCWLPWDSCCQASKDRETEGSTETLDIKFAVLVLVNFKNMVTWDFQTSLVDRQSFANSCHKAMTWASSSYDEPAKFQDPSQQIANTTSSSNNCNNKAVMCVSVLLCGNQYSLIEVTQTVWYTGKPQTALTTA